jgi:hypothetical protein
VAGRLKRRNERASDLAVRARDENSHAPNLLKDEFMNELGATVRSVAAL